jgi:hypothetical protein
LIGKSNEVISGITNGLVLGLNEYVGVCVYSAHMHLWPAHRYLIYALSLW